MGNILYFIYSDLTATPNTRIDILKMPRSGRNRLACMHCRQMKVSLSSLSSSSPTTGPHAELESSSSAMGMRDFLGHALAAKNTGKHVRLIRRFGGRHADSK